MSRRLQVAIGLVAGTVLVGQLIRVRQGHANPGPAATRGTSLGQCALAGVAPMRSDASLFRQPKGPTAVARFTGAATSLRLVEAAKQPGERARVEAGSGSGGFRVGGYVETVDLPVIAKERIEVVAGHAFIAPGQPLRLVGQRGERFEVLLELDGELQQTITGSASRSAVAIGEPASEQPWHAPAQAHAYVLHGPALELFSTWGDARQLVLTLRRSERSRGVLLHGAERRGGFVRVHYSRGITVDAWARESELEVLPSGETLDQLPATRQVASPSLTLADSPSTLRISHGLSVHLEATETAPVVGHIEPGAEVFVVQSVAGWTSVLPKPLSVAPVGDGQFWIRTRSEAEKPRPSAKR